MDISPFHFFFLHLFQYWFENKYIKSLHLHGWERSGTDMDISMAGAAAWKKETLVFLELLFLMFWDQHFKIGSC